MTIVAHLAETERLVLRELRAEDVSDAYVGGLNDPEVTAQTEARGRTFTAEEVRRYVVESNQAGVSQLIGLMLKPDGKHIGNIRLSGFSSRHRRVDLGIMLFDKTAWGRGLGTEALLGACTYVFGALRMHRICADYHRTNLSSRRIFQKAGFVEEGVFRDHFLVDGAFVDSIRVGKLDES